MQKFTKNTLELNHQRNGGVNKQWKPEKSRRRNNEVYVTFLSHNVRR